MNAKKSKICIGVLFSFILVLFTEDGMGQSSYVVTDTEKYFEANIPNAEITLVWEHSCIKHITKGEWQRAREVKETIDWQRANKEYLSLGNKNDFKEFLQRLKEAQEAKTKAGDKWSCNPPPEKFRVTILKMGLDPIAESALPESYVSNKKNAVTIEASAEIVSPCEKCQIDWSVSFPKQGISDAQFQNQPKIQYSHAILEKSKETEAMLLK